MPDTLRPQQIYWHSKRQTYAVVCSKAAPDGFTYHVVLLRHGHRLPPRASVWRERPPKGFVPYYEPGR